MTFQVGDRVERINENHPCGKMDVGQRGIVREVHHLNVIVLVDGQDRTIGSDPFNLKHVTTTPYEIVYDDATIQILVRRKTSAVE